MGGSIATDASPEVGWPFAFSTQKHLSLTFLVKSSSKGLSYKLPYLPF